jgi:nicotinate-nucleotide adenylyltransferase
MTTVASTAAIIAPSAYHVPMSLHLNYGGTFDPIHNGHLAVARSAAEQLGAVVHLTPCADPPHRACPVATADQRAEMVRRAIGGDARLALDRRELRRRGATYTLDTVRELRAELGTRQPIACLIGADAFRGLSSWRGWLELLDLTHLVALTRPGHRLDALDPVLEAEIAPRRSDESGRLRRTPGGLVLELEVPAWDVSSTEVRAGLAAGRDLRPWVPSSVLDWIAANGVYPGPLRGG